MRILWIYFLISLTFVIGIITYINPSILSDSNIYLKKIMGFDYIVIITLLTVTGHILIKNILYNFDILEKNNANIFMEARCALINYRKLFKIILAIAFAIIAMKHISNANEFNQSLINGYALLILALKILIMIDLLNAKFSVNRKIKSMA